MYPVQEGSAFSAATASSSCAAVASAGSSTRMDAMPTCSQSRCFMRT